MGDKTGISWTDATWNPTKGCSRVSAGCANCYAEVQAARIVRMGKGKGKPTAYDDLVRVTAGGDARWTGKVVLDLKALALPLRWSKPRRIFVNSMSDLFHESLTNEQIAAVFGVMACAEQHTFQVLTKRARRMREWFEWLNGHGLSICIREATEWICSYPIGPNDRLYSWWRDHHMTATWPLRNVWLGVSVENQAAADERIPELLATPAAVRFLSCEPLIGPVDLNEYLRCQGCGYTPRDVREHLDHHLCKSPSVRLHQVIAGCESGPGARPCDIEWLRELRGQCTDAGVAYFLKQAVETADGLVTEGPSEPGGYPAVWCGVGSKRKPGGVIELPYLDGVQHAAFPEVAR